MKAPFVWFGGKRRVAPEVWAALGDVPNYIEPFAGSLAVLLGRPHDMSNGTRRAETVNDADGFLANFWRALAHDPEAVAHWCDWPVNEVDLFARHLWLVNTGRSRLLEGMEADPDFYDAQVAGWWVWGVNAWIGSGWCSGDGPWVDTGDGIGKRPHLGNAESFRTQLSQLVPDAGQLMVSCSCPDWDDPCKHAVATLLAFSEELTARPELLVEWRCHPAEEDAGGRPQVGSRAATGRHLRLAPPPPDHDPPTGDRPARQRTPPRTPSRALPPPPSPYQSPRWQAFLGALPFPDPPDLPTEPAPLGHAMLGPVDVGAWIRSAVELLTSLE